MPVPTYRHLRRFEFLVLSLGLAMTAAAILLVVWHLVSTREHEFRSLSGTAYSQVRRVSDGDYEVTSLAVERCVSEASAIMFNIYLMPESGLQGRLLNSGLSFRPAGCLTRDIVTRLPEDTPSGTYFLLGVDTAVSSSGGQHTQTLFWRTAMFTVP